MRFKLIAVAALALLAGCATPPPPAPGSAESKVVVMNKFKNIAIGAMRVARENGFLTVKVALNNTSHTNMTMYYRFVWLGDDGFPVADEESWKTLNLYAAQATFLPAIAPVPKATDFRLEVKTP
ncbi:hypothetical protein BK659_16765 [Pseudomonas brassicacearum]|jgi:uncharacterized protein YcfL|uniref:DUF1425 domain-containing protein n=1 Tax=Pseudomonas brassicacearum TaxID=930166 RepID=A0A423H4S6_9PSED|nr:YcfL family protein [Pseudomonas brassicacearum]RON08210.1 hypothetical protein BK659_16765 [Pseudomonas brassicacearum]